MDIKQQWQETPLWQRLFLVLVLSAVISYLIFSLLISPKQEEYSMLFSEVEKLRNEAETLKSAADPKTLEKLEKKIVELRVKNQKKINRLEQFSSLIPQKPKVEEILEFISTSAQSSGLILNSFKVEKEEEVYLYYDQKDNSLKTVQKTDGKEKQHIPENAVHLKRTTVQFSTFGNINGIFQFIDRIGMSQRLLNVDSLNIKKEANKLSYILTISTYYSPEEK